MTSPTDRRARAAAAWHWLPPLAQDVLLAAGAATLALLPSLSGGGGDLSDRLIGGWAVPVVLVCAPLALRRRFPVGAALVSAGLLLFAAAVLVRDAGSWVVALAIGSAAYHRAHSRSALVCTGLAWLVCVTVLVGWPGGGVSPALFAAAGTMPIAAGYALRLRADRTADRARLQRAREERARSEERARIARDVHDIVGHHLSAIRLQALGGRRALGGAHADADLALGRIADISGTALGEIRDLLGLLRDDSARGGADLAGLADLAARCSGPELTVRLAMAPGSRLAADRGTQTCAYRVVQEALANVIRHSGAVGAVVRVEEDGGELVVTVDDDGTVSDRAQDGGGEGLRGMDARVAALGGRFSAGPRKDGGWRVRAVLPLGKPGKTARAEVPR